MISQTWDAKLVLISTEKDAAELLREKETNTRIISMPPMRRFEKQDGSYMRSVFLGMERLLKPCRPMAVLGGQPRASDKIPLVRPFKHFKMTEQHISQRVQAYLKELDGRNARLAEKYLGSVEQVLELRHYALTRL